ncbi:MULTISPECIES: TetR/AcrR family transcriptional regulator [Paraburkholderia]|uniref:TetR/AcrR family transcriptional regulator n=1 Tax=Paraburkholderia podalyriae TaxID=1938811 RepID=A0ABR7PTH6_9BURK|nr:TetR/AcrR family transcriptional regulator [Paraburkholderia podalyriae]MBC8749541.1 TetR/AcrR family transcriptional regulator [Paraburkholderia podalyriae]
MSHPSPYQRARSPEQKEERRRHLIDTARSLLLEIPDVHDLGINELARRAQMTKSNVYRYFESSEAVLLDVMVEEFAQWHTELVKALSRGGKRSGTIEHIARAFSATAAARPLLCRLTSIFPSILEHNVSAERLQQFKHGLLAVRKQMALDFHGCIPSMSTSAFDRFLHHAVPLMIGLWPLSHPAEVAAEMLGRPELAALRYDFQRDLEEGLMLLLRSLASK